MAKSILAMLFLIGLVLVCGALTGWIMAVASE